MRNINLIRLMIIALVLMINVNIVLSSDEIPAAKQDHPIALVGGTIHTITGEVIENGIVLFDEGKIVAFGTDVPLPANTESIDVSGKHVYPGLINASTKIGLVEVNTVAGSNDQSEMGSFNPNVKAEVALNPDTELIPVVRAHGVTIANSVPSSGRIAGKSAAIMLDGWTWEDLTLKAPVGMHLNWPRMTNNNAWWNTQTPAEQLKARLKSLKEMQDFFDEARAYMKAKDASGSRGSAYVETDLKLESMIPVLKGELALWINANEIKQIQAALDWTEKEGLKMVLTGGADSWRVASELKERNVPVVVNPIHTTPSRSWEGYDTPFTIPAKLHEAGVDYCIAYSVFSGTQHNVRYNAGTAVAHGLPLDEGVKSITINAARIMGIDDRVGSIDVGKDATLIVTSGNPLEILTSVDMEFIQGRKIELNNKHKRLYEKYREKYKQKGLIAE